MTTWHPGNSEGGNLPANPLLGGVFAHAPQEFGVATGPRGREAIRATCARLASGEYAQEFIPCICGSSEELCVAAVDRYGIPHRTVLCTRCGLLRTNPRMTSDAYAHFYQHLYRAIYERPGHDPDTYFAMQENTGRLRAIRTLRRVKLRAGSSVAEIGCGAGWNLIPYSKRGCRVVGWDVDDGYLALGRARGLDLRHGLLSAACSSGERFDLVVLSHVLEHLLDPIADLNALKLLLSVNGLLSIEVPSAFATARMERYFQNARTLQKRCRNPISRSSSQRRLCRETKMFAVRRTSAGFAGIANAAALRGRHIDSITPFIAMHSNPACSITVRSVSGTNDQVCAF